MSWRGHHFNMFNIWCMLLTSVLNAIYVFYVTKLAHYALSRVLVWFGIDWGKDQSVSTLACWAPCWFSAVSRGLGEDFSQFGGLEKEWGQWNVGTLWGGGGIDVDRWKIWTMLLKCWLTDWSRLQAANQQENKIGLVYMSRCECCANVGQRSASKTAMLRQVNRSGVCCNINIMVQSSKITHLI